MAWLDSHPPRTQQFRCPRRQRPSGIIGVHTAESFPDETGPDTGAEGVANFIRTRSNYGSYHLLSDSDSIIQLIRFECVAYHIATYGFNEHTIGISAATQAAKWNSLGDEWVRKTVRNMALSAARAAKWLKREYNITVPARRLTLAQARRGGKGFLAHGDADPDRRTDPGSTFPWGQFLNDYAAFMRGDTPEEDMPLNADDKKFIDDKLDAKLENHLKPILKHIDDIHNEFFRDLPVLGEPESAKYTGLVHLLRWTDDRVQRMLSLVRDTIVPLLENAPGISDEDLQRVREEVAAIEAAEVAAKLEVESTVTVNEDDSSS